MNMTKKQIQKEWRKIVKEVHDKPKYMTHYSKKVVFVRELLLIAKVFLAKIEREDNLPLNNDLYQRVMSEYYRQKPCLKI